MSKKRIGRQTQLRKHKEALRKISDQSAAEIDNLRARVEQRLDLAKQNRKDKADDAPDMPSKKTKKKAAAKSATAKALTAKNAAILEAAYPSTFDALVRQGETTSKIKKRKIDTAAAAKAKMATTNLSMHSFFKTDLTSLRLAAEKREERAAHRHQALHDGQARDARKQGFAAVRVQACTGEGANNDVVGQMYTNKELVSKVKRYRKKCCNHLQRQGEMAMEIHGLEVELADQETKFRAKLEVELANQETKFRAKLDAALRRIKQLEQKRDPISPPSPVSPVVATAFVKTQ